VSYQSRDKKRRYKAATKKAKKKAFRSSDTAKRWFLTIARKDCCCACCSVVLRRGRDIVYRHEPKEIRCLRCAERNADSKGYRTSLRWVQQNKRKARRGPAWMAESERKAV